LVNVLLLRHKVAIGKGGHLPGYSMRGVVPEIIEGRVGRTFSRCAVGVGLSVPGEHLAQAVLSVLRVHLVQKAQEEWLGVSLVVAM
jgi:hypothetical protein